MSRTFMFSHLIKHKQTFAKQSKSDLVTRPSETNNDSKGQIN